MGDTQGWRHLISTWMQFILERVAMCKGPCEQISQGEQEAPNAHKHADLERVVAAQHGRFCLRLTKCFHDGKLLALNSLKAVSLTLEFLSLFPNLQNGPPNLPYLTKTKTFFQVRTIETQCFLHPFCFQFKPGSRKNLTTRKKSLVFWFFFFSLHLLHGE